MREIKFRALFKDVLKQEYKWFYATVAEKPTIPINYGQHTDWEQFTGIQDSQGVNIYENDIVKVLRGDWLSKDDEDPRTIDQYTYDIASTGRVIFTKGSFTIHLGKDRMGYDIHESLIAQRYGFVLVIGNIHQHAHLLEE